MKNINKNDIPWYGVVWKTLLVTAVLFAFSFTTVNAQTQGATCNGPIIVSSLPFTDSGNTADYGNNYDGPDVPTAKAPDGVFDGTGSTGYLDGYDAVYEYTPSSDELITISGEFDINGWHSIYVFTGCPFSITVGYHTTTSGTSRTIEELPLTGGETYYIVISDWDEEDVEYTLNIQTVEVCEGTPDAGVAALNPEEGQSGTTANLTVTGYSQDAGVSALWESKDEEGNWVVTTLGSNDDINVIFSGDQGEVIELRYAVTCSGSQETAYSNVVTFTIDNTDCVPSYSTGCSLSDYIAEFHLDGENGTSLDRTGGNCSDGDYIDKTDESIDLTGGNFYSADITAGTNGDRVTIWLIDGDSNATMITETIPVSTNGSEIDLDIPASLDDGTYTMRILLNYDFSGTTNPTPCDPNSSYGQAIDYTVNVTAAEDCANATAGTLLTQDMSFCAETAFTLEVEGNSDPADGLTRQWMSSVDGGTDWAVIDGATGSSYTVSDGVSEETQFKYVVSCDFDSSSDETGVVTIGLSPDNECYCEPTINNQYDWVDEIYTDGAVSDISFSAPNAPGAYVDETGTILQAFAGQEFEMSVRYTWASQNKVAVWVDWDENGNFDNDEQSDEKIFFESNGTTPKTFTFVVPAYDNGQYRMRVRGAYSGQTLEPCGNEAEGLTVDFTFEIVDAPTCPAPFDLAVTDITESSAEFSWTANADQSDVYLVEAGEDAPDENSTPTHPGVLPGLTLDNLTDNTDYAVYVRADCDAFGGNDGVSTWAGPVSFTTLATPPDNDSCEEAMALECGADPVTVSSVGSTAVSPDGCSIGDNGVWFSFVGTGGDITINSSASFDHKMSMQLGSCDDLTFIACKDGSINDETYTIGSTIDGETYYVYVAHYSSFTSSTGDITIAIDCAEPPACDAPTMELAAYADPNFGLIEGCLTAGSEFYVNAVLSGGDGNDSYDVSANGGDAVNVSVDGSYMFGPFALGTDVNISAVGAEDADCGVTESIDSPAICPPDNDSCEEAMALECGADPVTVSSVGSTAVNTTSCSMGHNGVWFSFVGTGGDITVSSIASFDHKFSINTGTCDDLTNIACKDSPIGSNQEKSHTVESSIEGEIYYVYVANWSGGSSTTGDVTISIECADVEPEACETPTDLTLGEATFDEDSAHLPVSWTAGGSETQWEVSYENSGDTTDNGTEIVNDDPNTILDLTAGEGYDIKVRAVCADGANSDWSDTESIFITPPVDDCETPTDLAVNVMGPTYSNVTWSGNANDYEIAWGVSPYSPGDTGGNQLTTGDTNIYAIGTLPGTAYDVYVRAICDDENSEWATVTFTSEDADCLAPTGTTIDNITDDGADITWTPGDAADDHWEISIAIFGESADDGMIADVFNDPSYTATGLDANTMYSVFVRTVCTEQESSDWFGATTFTTDVAEEPCDAPELVEVSNITEDSADISWSGGSEQGYWIIAYGPAPYSPEEDDGVNGYYPSMETTLTDLEPGTDYNVYVRAMCQESYDNLSDWTSASFTTDATEEPCEAPELTLAALDDMGNYIEDDCLEEGSEFYVMVTLSGGSGNTSYSVSVNGDAFEVDANDSDSFGPFMVGTNISASAVGVQNEVCMVEATMESPAICGDEPQDCPEPTSISFGLIDFTSAQVSWTLGDESQDEWEVVYAPAPFNPLTDAGETVTVYDNPTVTLVDLTPGTTYQIYVRAICDEPGDYYPDPGGPGNPGDDGVVDIPEPCADPYNDEAATSDVYISSIEISGIGADLGDSTYDLSYTSSSMSTDGYGVIANPILTVYPGLEGTYTVSSGMVSGNPNQYYYAVWIDFNQDGCFDENEQIIWSDNDLWGGGIPNGEPGVEDVPMSWAIGIAPGTYQARIRNSMVGYPLADGNGDGEALDFTVEVITAEDAENVLGVDNQVFTDFTYYPNPVNHQLNLHAGTPIEQVEVFNLLGQKVIQVKPNVLETSLDTDRLQAGVYLMNVTIDGSQKTFRVVKK